MSLEKPKTFGLQKHGLIIVYATRVRKNIEKKVIRGYELTTRLGVKRGEACEYFSTPHINMENYVHKSKAREIRWTDKH